MSRTLASSLLCATLVGGCFYTESISQRPSIDIVPISGDEVYRDTTVMYRAKADDLNVTFRWRAYSCTDALAEAGCDSMPYTTPEGVDQISLYIPRTRDAGGPVQQVRLVLAATNERGVTAKPEQELIIPIADRPPDIVLFPVSHYGFVANTPIQLYVRYGDSDDGPEQIRTPLDWTVYTPPSNPAYTLTDLAVTQDPTDPAHLQAAKTLVPTGTGTWDVHVIATDPLGTMSPPAASQLTVVDDSPPCLRQLSPIVATAGATLPISDITRFQVAVVQDDLDPYPSNPADPVLGTATFAWSIQAPGASSHLPLAGATGNSVELDPAIYTPGDIVELRVEIYDRNHIAITCPDNTQTCSVISQPTCLQRQTWRLEIR